MVDWEVDTLQHTAVLPALHRRGQKEREAPAEQGARYWFDLQFRVVRLLNIITWSDSEVTDRDNWIIFSSRTC